MATTNTTSTDAPTEEPTIATDDAPRESTKPAGSGYDQETGAFL